jgi:hypothetical protein
VGRDPEGCLPAPPACLDLLEWMVAERGGSFGAADAARARDRESIVQDEGEARRCFRYHPESRSTSHRAFEDLVATLARDAAGTPMNPARSPRTNLAATPEDRRSRRRPRTSRHAAARHPGP